MEWNINSDKLILELLVNHAPPSCIRVNIISISMTTNTNSEVAKMIPCIKNTNNMRSDLSLINKFLSVKAIDN